MKHRTSNSTSGAFALMALTLAFAPKLAFSASAADIDKMTTYAVVLGRGVACGASIQAPMQRVGAWFTQRFPNGSNDQKTYLPVFMAGVEQHARQQRDGQSPDSCSTVLRTFNTFPWP